MSNGRSGGRSGTLKLKLWATDSPYSGGAISGYLIAQANLGQLAGGQSLVDIVRTRGLADPPGGTYFMTMTLSEFDGSQDRTVDYVTFTRTASFGGGGGGGGGSLDAATLSSLLAGGGWWWRRRRLSVRGHRR